MSKEKRSKKEMILPKYYQKKEIEKEETNEVIDEDAIRELEEKLKKRG